MGRLGVSVPVGLHFLHLVLLPTLDTSRNFDNHGVLPMRPVISLPKQSCVVSRL